MLCSTGNTLRYILMENPDTDFCGYSVPHPYVPKMNVRLQTRKVDANGAPLNSLALLKAGLNDMMLVCDSLDATFDKSLADFKKNSSVASKGSKAKKAK